MDVATIIPWLTGAALVLGLGNTITTFFTSGSKENAKKLAAVEEAFGKKIDAVGDTIEGHDRRISKIETEMEHLPDKDSVIELKLALADLKGTVGVLNESLGSVQRTVLRIDDYLRQDKVG